MTTSRHIRELYLRFFEERGHAVIGSAPLVPDGDPSVLFTSAGMHPLVPYLRGQAHPAGRRLVGYQACVRTNDIDEVGDASHLTCFEMLGNWSLGDYGKEQSIRWSFEFLTEQAWLGIDLDRFWVTVFAGDEDVPRDDASAEIWVALGLSAQRVIPLSAEHNWWATGPEGPCGPDTEIFYDRTLVPCERGDACLPSVCPCGRFVEVWNNVFMSYERHVGSLHELPVHNVDTGMGLERIVSVLGGHQDVYAVEGLRRPMERLSRGTRDDVRSLRIATDHLRTAVFVLGDACEPQPGNQGAGYVLRRLIRRAIHRCDVLGISVSDWIATADTVIDVAEEAYPALRVRRDRIVEQIRLESDRFERVRKRGHTLLLREIERARREHRSELPGEVAFRLHETFGFPVELTRELAGEHGIGIDEEELSDRREQHRERSRSTSAKSGLADVGEQSARLHTATHLLHAALRDVLGSHVEQRGSNITAERLRFDFSHDSPLTPEQLEQTRAWVQNAIDEDLPVTRSLQNTIDAKADGAIGLFPDRYDAHVSVYTIGDRSKELCAGPHAATTGELGRFRILGERSCGAGVRRIRAVLDDCP